MKKFFKSVGKMLMFKHVTTLSRLVEVGVSIVLWIQLSTLVYFVYSLIIEL